MVERFTGKSTIGISTTEFRQYCRFEKLPRLSQEYDNTNFHVVSYCPESPTPLHLHLHPHTTPRQFFKFGNIVEIPIVDFPSYRIIISAISGPFETLVGLGSGLISAVFLSVLLKSSN